MSAIQTLTGLLHVLTNHSVLFNSLACIDYKYFDVMKVREEIATLRQLLSGPLSGQATTLYNLLAHKYCSHYWFVQINDSSHDAWRHNSYDFFTGFSLANEAFGAVYYKTNGESVRVAWSNSLPEWSRCSEYRRDFADVMPNASDTAVQSRCDDDDNRNCRTQLVEASVENKFNWNAPLWSGCTLYENTSITY